MPDIAIELVSVEKGALLKTRRLQMPSKDFAVDVDKLGTMPAVIASFAKVCLGKFDLAEGSYTVCGSPQHVNVALLVRYRHGLRLPFGKDSSLAKSPQQRGGRLRFAREVREEQIESKCLRGIQMMEVPVTLVRMRCQEGTRCRFGLFQQVRGAMREREDMLLLHISAPVPKHTGCANAEVSPLELGEMFFRSS